jgi:dCTP deaminase
MAVLCDMELSDWGLNGGVLPYNSALVNPASMDLTLMAHWIDTYDGSIHKEDETITIYPPSDFREVLYKVQVIISKLLRQKPPAHKPTAILASTQEFVRMPNGIAGDVKLKSTMARSGLDHALAGWIDPGFEGRITLELHAHRKVVLTPGQRICQIVLHTMSEEPAVAYVGRYQHQSEPTPARSYNNGRSE